MTTEQDWPCEMTTAASIHEDKTCTRTGWYEVHQPTYGLTRTLCKQHKDMVEKADPRAEVRAR